MLHMCALGVQIILASNKKNSGKISLKQVGNERKVIKLNQKKLHRKITRKWCAPLQMQYVFIANHRILTLSFTIAYRLVSSIFEAIAVLIVALIGSLLFIKYPNNSFMESTTISEFCVCVWTIIDLKSKIFITRLLYYLLIDFGRNCIRFCIVICHFCTSDFSDTQSFIFRFVSLFRTKPDRNLSNFQNKCHFPTQVLAHLLAGKQK